VQCQDAQGVLDLTLASNVRFKRAHILTRDIHDFSNMWNTQKCCIKHCTVPDMKNESSWREGMDVCSLGRQLVTGSEHDLQTHWHLSLITHDLTQDYIAPSECIMACEMVPPHPTPMPSSGNSQRYKLVDSHPTTCLTLKCRSHR